MNIVYVQVNLNEKVYVTIEKNKNKVIVSIAFMWAFRCQIAQ